MGFYFHRYPTFFDWFYPNRIWRKEPNKIYLTFDDGPVPEVTEWVLDLLAQYQIRATFFCVGENLLKYPEIKKRMVNEGHQLANHTFNHNNGRKADWETYWRSIQDCEKQIGESSAKIFRPPYGKLSNSFAKKITKEFQIIMWTVLSGDFDLNLSKEKCLRKVVKASEKGGIVVFHDNEKCFKKDQWVLPKYIEEMQKKGLSFELL